MWRIAVAPELQRYDHAELAQREADYFGAAAGGNGRRSEVVLRFESAWIPGSLRQWPAGPPTVRHPEVNRVTKVSSHLYLGYGPLTTTARRTDLKEGRSALDPRRDRVAVRLRYREDLEQGLRLPEVLTLVNLFGTLGGRSRNGWGSVRLEAVRQLDLGDAPQRLTDREKVGDWLRRHGFVRPWEECLRLSWTHAVGEDERGLLIWRTKEQRESWQKVMGDLAQAKIGVRTQFHFRGGRQHPDVCERHVLAYPVTNHEVGAWPRDFRMPNQLRFKVVREPDDGYRAYIFHLPWRPPPDDRDNDRVNLALATRVWRQVHQTLDRLCERWG
jgi:CRISPR-associated protein Cmr1